MRRKSLFFDLDGTLTDPQAGITRCIQYALAELGEPVPDTQALLWCIGPPLRSSFVKLLGERRAPQAVRLYRERFADVGLFENTPYPAIHDTLDRLTNADVDLFVASSKPLVYVRRILEHFALAGYFKTIYGSELDGTRTDKSELLMYALTDSGADSGRSVMIGDRKHDAIGARDNGMAFVGVLYGYGNRAEFAEVDVHHLIDDHPQLLDLVQS